MSLKFFLRLMFATVAVVYLGVLVSLFTFQRRMMYFPGAPIAQAAQLGLQHAETLRLATKTGQTIMAWYQPAEEGKSIFLFLHGNGGTLANRVDLLNRLQADGSGFLAIDYEGYGSSSGTPSEVAFLEDGETAYAAIRARGYATDRIVALGESLGTGVAVAVAAAHPVQAIVLDAAYSSTVDVAASQFWIFPIRLLMIDTFKSIDRIGAVKAPKLILHGAKDPIIPIALGRKLFEASPAPKTFIDYADRGHMVLSVPGVLDTMKVWLADQRLTGTAIASRRKSLLHEANQHRPRYVSDVSKEAMPDMEPTHPTSIDNAKNAR